MPDAAPFDLRGAVGVPVMLTPLQGPAWGRVQEAQGRRVVVGCGPGWQARAIVEERAVGSYLYAPYGPVAQDPAAFEDALAWLRAQARLHGCWFLRVEPPAPAGWLHPTDSHGTAVRRRQLHTHGFRRAADLQPSRTRVVDLRRAEQEVLADMTGSNRTLHRSTAKRGLTLEASQDPADVRHLVRLLEVLADRQGFTPREAEHLRTLAGTVLPRGEGTLYLARAGGEVVSSILTVDDGGVRLFLHSASDPAHRKLRAQQSLMVRALLDARERGLAAADLFGIGPDDDPDHPWAGFTRFKASFGGHVVDHLGAWEAPVRPLLHRAARIVRAAQERLPQALTPSP